MRIKFWFLVMGGFFGATFFTVARADDFDAPFKSIVDAKGRTSDSERLQTLFKTEWAYTMSVSPEFATYVGFSGYDTKWTDLSAAAIAERKRLSARPLAVLATIDRAQLSALDRVSYDLFKRRLEEAVEGNRFPEELQQVTQLGGIQQDAAQIFMVMPAATTEKLENQLARLRALPEQIDQVIALLKEGMAKGITPPQITLRDVPQQVLIKSPTTH